MGQGLLVVPLAPGEAGSLTLAEWDALTSCERVVFEHPGHPLVERLRSAGVTAGPFDDEPDAARSGWALVADPDSSRIVELARAGATVTSGFGSAPDALTAAHGARTGRRAATSLGGLALLMARLRGPDGCPWDAEQTHESLRVHLLEEAHEVLEAIDAGTTGPELEEELGDLLLQVFFHAELASEDGRFDVATVADRLAAKLLHRHPHVFGDVVVAGAAEVVANWEAIKAQEKASDRPDPFDGIPATLPALLATYKVQKKAAGLGFEADAATARAAIEAAAREDPTPDAVGELLFWTVALARSAGVDPEGALSRATLKFRQSL